MYTPPVHVTIHVLNLLQPFLLRGHFQTIFIAAVFFLLLPGYSNTSRPVSMHVTVTTMGPAFCLS